MNVIESDSLGVPDLKVCLIKDAWDFHNILSENWLFSSVRFFTENEIEIMSTVPLSKHQMLAGFK